MCMCVHAGAIMLPLCVNGDEKKMERMEGEMRQQPAAANAARRGIMNASD